MVDKRSIDWMAGFITEDPNIFEEDPRVSAIASEERLAQLNENQVSEKARLEKKLKAYEEHLEDGSGSGHNEQRAFNDYKSRLEKSIERSKERLKQASAGRGEDLGGAGGAGGAGEPLNQRQLLLAQLATKAVDHDLTDPKAYEQAGRSKGITKILTGNDIAWSRIPWSDLMNAQPPKKRENILQGLLDYISRGL